MVVVVMVDLKSASSFKQILVILLLVKNNTSIRDASTYKFCSFLNIVQNGGGALVTNALVKAYNHDLGIPNQ